MSRSQPCGLSCLVAHRPTLGVLAALLAGPALFACAGDAGDVAGADWTVAVDTADGVVQVVNTPPAEWVGPGYVIEEELRIGTLEGQGPDQFGQVKGLAVLSDGRMAVLDAQAQEVRVFGPDGEHLATWGGKGSGPGEFESPSGLMIDDADRLWVPDRVTRRMTVLDPDSGLVTTYAFPFLRSGFVWQGAMLDDGRIVKPSLTLAPERRDMLRVYGPGMTLVDSILDPAPREEPADPRDYPGSFVIEGPDGTIRGAMSVAYYPRVQRHYSRAGYIWSNVDGEAVYRITRTGLHGDTSRVIETRREPVPLTDSARQSLVDMYRERLAGMGASTDRDWSKIPHVKPPIEQLFVTDDGDLWVRTPAPDSGIWYDVYDPAGRYDRTVATTLQLPPFVAPIVRGDTFWAVAQDEMQVPYVIRGRIRAVNDNVRRSR